FAKISEMGIRYSALPGHTTEIAAALNDVLSEKWADLRGVKIVSFGINSVKASEKDEAMIKGLQKNAVFRNANMAAAHLVGAQAQAMDWGAIDTLPEIVGLALHTDGHVGYYVGNGYAVEWRGFSYGCVRTKVKDRKWKYWYKLPFIQYREAAAENTAPEIALGSRLLKRGMVGSDVKALQELLM
ncbi:MAG: hypothetical protein SOY30_03320, partial [Eubacteriales bacterium]|nr:hypothetical protein [Eubacteriales bacterium]